MNPTILPVSPHDTVAIVTAFKFPNQAFVSSVQENCFLIKLL